MDKPKALHTLAVIAAVVSAVGILLNITVVLNPHIAAVLLGYGSVKDLMEAKLDGSASALMLLQAAIPAVMTVICIINAACKKISRNKSLMTLIAAPVAYVVIAAATFIIYTISLKFSMAGGIENVQLISAVTSVRNVLSYLQVFALVMIMCAASVEHYIAVKEDH